MKIGRHLAGPLGNLITERLCVILHRGDIHMLFSLALCDASASTVKNGGQFETTVKPLTLPIGNL